MRKIVFYGSSGSGKSLFSVVTALLLNGSGYETVIRPSDHIGSQNGKLLHIYLYIRI